MVGTRESSSRGGKDVVKCAKRSPVPQLQGRFCGGLSQEAVTWALCVAPLYPAPTCLLICSPVPPPLAHEEFCLLSSDPWVVPYYLPHLSVAIWLPLLPHPGPHSLYKCVFCGCQS